MAITRAQQVRQMLEDGGMLVQPSMTGKRPGYRRSKTDESGGGLRDSAKDPGSEGPGDRKDYDDLKAEATRDKYFDIKGPPEDVRKGRDNDFISKQKEIEKKLKQGNFKIGDVLKTLRNLNPISQLATRGIYGLVGNNPDFELSFLSKLTPEQVAQFNNQELTDLYEATQDPDTDYFGDLSFEDALGDKYGKLSYDAFQALRNPNIKTNIMDPQGEFGNMNFPEYVGRMKGSFGLLRSGDVGGTTVIKNKDGTFSLVENKDGGGRDNLGEVPYYLRNQQPGDGDNTGDDSNDNQFDFSRLLAEGGMPMDAPYVGGGIMDAAGRQQYFLGKLVKSAKKAVRGVTRGIKKIAKSPIGKAALAFGAYKLGSPLFGKGTFFGTGFNPLKDATSIGPMSSGLGKLLSKVGLTDFVTGDLTLAGKIGLGFGIPAALSIFSQPKEEDKPIDYGPDIDFQKIINNPYAYTLPRQYAEGGRIGLKEGKGIMKVASNDANERLLEQLFEQFLEEGFSPAEAAKKAREAFYDRDFAGAKGGDVEPVAKKTMPLLDMDGKEMDLRAEGGFVPIGRMEKADDVPARLSKNEFVFTADAVRNAGEGDVDKGAEVMYNMMKNLESGGEVSEESQGLSGAREMFQTSKRLEEVL